MINDNCTVDPGVTYKPSGLTDDEIDNIITDAISTFGKENQIMKLFEEMSELQNAICKHSCGRSTNNDVCEEIADVMIVCMQMAEIFGVDNVEKFALLKMKRLKQRIENFKTQKGVSE